MTDLISSSATREAKTCTTWGIEDGQTWILRLGWRKVRFMDWRMKF